MEIVAAAVSIINTGILTAIYFKLGVHSEKHKITENRLNVIERKI